jgi:hypothetical protein
MSLLRSIKCYFKFWKKLRTYSIQLQTGYPLYKYCTKRLWQCIKLHPRKFRVFLLLLQDRIPSKNYLEDKSSNAENVCSLITCANLPIWRSNTHRIGKRLHRCDVKNHTWSNYPTTTKAKFPLSKETSAPHQTIDTTIEMTCNLLKRTALPPPWPLPP